MTPSEVAQLKARAESMTHWKYNELSGLSHAPSDPALGKAIRALIAENEAKGAEIERLREVLDRMVQLYENECDPENLKRPDWLVEALTGKEEK